MKHILLSCLFATGLFAAKAQTAAHLPADAATAEAAAPAPKAAAPAAASNVVYITPENRWSMIDMKVADNTAWFYHINGLNSLRVYVTDNEGRIRIDQKLSARANGVDVTALRKGNYFVTLIDENTDQRKAFMLER